MKVSLLTLGCKVNQSEIHSIESALINYGHDIVPLSKSPDICIINTCTVTAKSDYQSRQYMRKALKVGAQVYATGCYSQLNKKLIQKTLSDSIRIIDNDNKLNIINEICSISEYKTLRYKGPRSRAFVKIQDGCNFRCTYCAIPLARGKAESKDMGEIASEIFSIYSSGINEIVLTGIHIGLYGTDMNPKMKLSDLLRYILINTSVPRIRLSSLEISEIDDELLEIVAEERICKHLHIPLQSGDDMILKKMARTYRSVDYINEMELIFRKFPDISVGTDVIVGFPGEKSDSFYNTYKLVNDTDFSYLHVFPYSKRENTRALNLPDHVDSKTKNERVRLLRNVAYKKKRSYMEKFVGRTIDVIVESKINDKIYSGTSGNYLKVNVTSDTLKQGSLIFIKATDVLNDHISGIPI